MTSVNVTVSETAAETANSTAVSEEGSTREAKARLRARARVRVARFVAEHESAVRFLEHTVGDRPSPWSEAPASPAELVRYARDGQWCADDSIISRGLGRAYSALVAIPVSVVVYLALWVIQRPGRLVAFGFLVFIVWLLCL